MAKEVSFDWLESLTVNPAQRYSPLLPRQMNSGSMGGTTEVRFGGDANVKIDNANRRIIISDGTDDRVLIGFDLGGF